MKLILSNDSSLYSACIDSNEPQRTHFSFQAQTLYPPRPKDTTFFASFGPRIVGSCRGLLCLNFPKCAVLWNPSTKTHHEMPEPDQDSDFQERKGWRFHAVQGLVYDEINDDYKVIRVYQYLGSRNGAQKFDSKVLVYSLKSNSWKRVPDFPYFVRVKMMNDVFVNGALHFNVSTKKKSIEGDDTVDSDCMIAAFDVSNHTYKVVTRLACGEMKYELELGVLGECLSLIRNYAVGVSQCLVMKEYGVNSSWTELFHVRRDDDFLWLKFRPISYLGDEKHVLLEGGGQISCFDVESKTFKDFEINGIDENFEVNVCMTSEVVLGTVDCNDCDKAQQFDEEDLEHKLNEENLELQVNEENLVVLGSVDGNDCDKMQQQVNEDVNEENLELQVNEENLESEVVLGSVDCNDCDKVKQLNEEDLEHQVNEENIDSEVVLGSVDGNDCDKMQQQVNEYNLERVSAERDLVAYMTGTNIPTGPREK